MTWDYLATDLLENVKPVIQELPDRLIEDIFGKYSFGGLPSSVK